MASYNIGRQITNVLALNQQKTYDHVMRKKIREQLGVDHILFNPEDLPYLAEIIHLNEDGYVTLLAAKKAYKHTQLIIIINGMLEGVSAHATDEADLPLLQELAEKPGMDQEVSIEHIIRILRDKLANAKLGTPFDSDTKVYLNQIRDDPNTPLDIRHRAHLAILVISGLVIGQIGNVSRGGALKKSKRNKKRVRKTKKNK